MDNPRAALPGWCSASGQWSRRGPSRPSARHLSSAGFGTSGTGAGRSWEYRCNPCESKLTPSQNAQQIRDERGIGTRPSFRQVRLDPLDRREQPQRRVQSQEVGAKGRSFGIRAGATLLQNALEFARDRVQPSLQARSVQFATAECPPVGEQAFHDLQAYPANCFSGSSSIDQLLKVAFQVRPADLPQFQGQLAVDRPTVA